ncbi:MAG: hypothetical protein KGI71_05270 [Patescibacteria group bacterium]|nr:hypothetical protein [Patescibacteria group bacterium]
MRAGLVATGVILGVSALASVTLPSPAGATTTRAAWSPAFASAYQRLTVDLSHVSAWEGGNWPGRLNALAWSLEGDAVRLHNGARAMHAAQHRAVDTLAEAVGTYAEALRVGTADQQAAALVTVSESELLVNRLLAE